MIKHFLKLRRGFLKWKKKTGTADGAKLVFYTKDIDAESGLKKEGEISDYFFIEQEKERETGGEMKIFLRVLNTPENLALLKSDLLVAENYNLLYDGYQIDIINQVFAPGSLIYLRREVRLTGNKNV